MTFPHSVFLQLNLSTLNVTHQFSIEHQQLELTNQTRPAEVVLTSLLRGEAATTIERLYEEKSNGKFHYPNI